MKVLPAIDLRDGRCVRLEQGDYERETVYDGDPATVARQWEQQGAKHLHIVDLDGAREGKTSNLEAIRSIVEAVDATCQIGGGVRDQQTIDQLLELGIDRVVIGTLAIKKPEWFREMCQKYPQKLVLAIDSRDGFVATDGWLLTSRERATDIAQQFHDLPVAAINYTDIDVDGMLKGPNLAAMREMKLSVDVPVVAAGGVTSAGNVAELAAIPMDGCIIGKALYEEKISLADALAAAAGTL